MRLGTEAQRVAAVELGVWDDDTLLRLATAFGLDVAEFVAGRVVSERSAHRVEGMADATVFLFHSGHQDFMAADTVVLEHALRVARASVLRGASSAHAGHRFFEPVPVAGPRRRDAAQQGHRLARHVRAWLRLEVEPAGDLVAILEERFGIAVVVDVLRSRGLRASAVVDADKCAAAVVLGVRSTKHPPRDVVTRVSLAHELCHVLFDPLTPGSVRVDLDDRSEGNAAITLEESRANGFAAEFLMPVRGVRELVGASTRDVLEPQRAKRLVQRVQERFATSWPLTVYHLANHGVIAPQTRDDLLRSEESIQTLTLHLPGVGRGSLRFGRAPTQDDQVPALAAGARDAAIEWAEGTSVALGTDPVAEAWDVVRHEWAPAELRVRALEVLVLDGDAALPTWLADAFDQELRGGPWRDALVLAAERTAFEGDELRTRVTTSLLRVAEALRGTGPDEVMWSAIRRYASMVPVGSSDALIGFLGDDERATTLQVALQGVSRIFEASPTEGVPARDRLRARVHALALARIKPDRVHGSEDAAMCFACFEAALQLRDPEIDAVQQQLESLGRSRQIARARALRDAVGALPG